MMHVLAFLLSTAQALQPSRDVFLLSSFSDGVLGNAETASLLRDAVRDKAGDDGKVRLTYIPTASYALRRTSARTPGVQRQRSRRDGKQKRDRIVEFFGGPSKCDAVTLDLWDSSIKHAACDVEPLSGADALSSWDPSLVVVDGGNTFWLRHCMQDWLGALKDSPAVYVGVSAGSICAGRHVDTALWKGWDDPGVVDDRDWTSVEGLDIGSTGASFFPHASPEYSALVAEKTEDRHVPLVALEEGGAYVISRRGGEARYVPPQAS